MVTGEFASKILVIDDSAPTREFLRTCLTSAGCEVITAPSGIGAVPLVEQQKPDWCYIWKPFDEDKLLSAVVAALDERRSLPTEESDAL